MSVQKESDLKWDVDVIEFWNATLQSYKTCHDNETAKHDDPETISTDLIDSLPKKVKEADNSKQDESSVKSTIPETQSNKTDALPNKRKVMVEEQEEEEVEEGDNYEAQVADEEEEAEEEEEEEDPQQYPQQSSNKKAKYQNEYSQEEESYYEHCNQYPQSYSTPAQPPPPPPLPSMPSPENEALSNLIMAWYYAGYYTGLYQARQR